MAVMRLLIVIIVLIIAAVCQDRLLISDREFKLKLAQMRQTIAGRSLIGKWKLTEESNFVLNSKNNMINDLYNKNRHRADRINFLEKTNIIRQVEGFFQSQQEGDEPSNLYLQLIDGKYRNGSMVVLQVSLSEMQGKSRVDKNITLWSNQNKTIFATCILVTDGIVIAKFNIAVRLQIFSSFNQKEELGTNSKIYIKLASNSFSFYAQIRPITDEYTYLVIVQVAFTLLFLIAVIKFKPKESIYNISDLMVLQSATFVMVANAIILSICLKKLDTNLWVVAVCCLINIILDLFFLRNYEDVVVNSFFVRHHEQLIRSNGKRIVFCFCLIVVYLIVVYIWYQSVVLWIYESFLLLALQINYSYVVGGKGGFSVSIAMTILFTRFPFFYYLFRCTQLTRYNIDLNLVFIFIEVNVIMLAFIFLQRYFGSRFIIIRELIPDYHNYFAKHIQSTGGEECPICTQLLSKDSQLKDTTQPKQIELSQTSNVTKKQKQSIRISQPFEHSDPPNMNEEIKQNQRKVMITPCNHAYHTQCLQDWMTKRLNCPMCRADLPPLEQQTNSSYCC